MARTPIIRSHHPISHMSRPVVPLRTVCLSKPFVHISSLFHDGGPTLHTHDQPATLNTQFSSKHLPNPTLFAGSLSSHPTSLSSQPHSASLPAPHLLDLVLALFGRARAGGGLQLQVRGAHRRLGIAHNSLVCNRLGGYLSIRPRQVPDHESEFGTTSNRCSSPRPTRRWMLEWFPCITLHASAARTVEECRRFRRPAFGAGVGLRAWRRRIGGATTGMGVPVRLGPVERVHAICP